MAAGKDGIVEDYVLFNTATSAERLISQISEKNVIIKRATLSPETGMKYLSLSLSDKIKFWYGKPRLIELIFKRGNSRCISLFFWEGVPFSYR